METTKIRKKMLTVSDIAPKSKRYTKFRKSYVRQKIYDNIRKFFFLNRFDTPEKFSIPIDCQPIGLI